MVQTRGNIRDRERKVKWVELPGALLQLDYISGTLYFIKYFRKGFNILIRSCQGPSPYVEGFNNYL